MFGIFKPKVKFHVQSSNRATTEDGSYVIEAAPPSRDFVVQHEDLAGGVSIADYLVSKGVPRRYFTQDRCDRFGTRIAVGVPLSFFMWGDRSAYEWRVYAWDDNYASQDGTASPRYVLLATLPPSSMEVAIKAAQRIIKEY